MDSIKNATITTFYSSLIAAPGVQNRIYVCMKFIHKRVVGITLPASSGNTLDTTNNQ